MRLKCVDCGAWHDIPEDKMDEFNIYHKWDGRTAMSVPQLLCCKCTNKWINRG